MKKMYFDKQYKNEQITICSKTALQDWPLNFAPNRLLDTNARKLLTVFFLSYLSVYTFSPISIFGKKSSTNGTMSLAEKNNNFINTYHKQISKKIEVDEKNRVHFTFLKVFAVVVLPYLLQSSCETF